MTSYGSTKEENDWTIEMSPAPKTSPGNNLAVPSIVVEDSSTESTKNGSPRSLRIEKGTKSLEDLDFEESCVHIAENSIEAHRIENNYKFGLKMWKSNLTSRPIDQRSDDVRELYSDIDKIRDVKVSTIRPSNILYTILFGWWLSLLYIIVGLLMVMTVIGLPYVPFCWKLAGYFFWPFGKFVSQATNIPFRTQRSSEFPKDTPLLRQSSQDGVSLSRSNSNEGLTGFSKGETKRCWGFWSRLSSLPWLLLGLPILWTAHILVFAFCWFFVVSIPTAKLNGKMLTKVLYLPPSEIEVGVSSDISVGKRGLHRRILMYSYQSMNVYYYKYTVDGVNIILVNLLLFVIVSIIIGFTMDIPPLSKATLGVLAIIPLTYYIGMAIASISAQSTFAVGAFLNATFGSAVEVILCILILMKGKESNDNTYQEIVKSALAGAFFMGILFIPGMSMVVGGLKFHSQRFNPKSTNITASYLFLTVVGVFAPSIFHKIYGAFECKGCELLGNTLDDAKYKNSSSFRCQTCAESLSGYQGDRALYNNHIKPLVYSVCIVLPLIYVIGVVYTLKSHSKQLFSQFETELKEEVGGSLGGHEGTATWSRLKCAFVLFICAVLTALCAELISDNMQPLLEATGMSEHFVGVSLLAIVAGLPEVVNGILFALHNNVNLGIEVGCATAIQVGMVQIPALVLTNLIYDMHFDLVFNDVHLWAVMFAVVIINYIFQDGKSDYFQGSVVISLHILIMLMYFFMVSENGGKATTHGPIGNITTTTTTPSP